MQQGQPIWWDYKGKKRFGVVTKVKADKAGVVAVVQTSDGHRLVNVAEPHKVRELEAAKKVLAELGFQMTEDGKALIAPPPPKEVAAIDPENMFNADDLKFLKFLGNEAFQPLDPPEDKK